MGQDKISLEGMVFYGYHGVTTEEKKLGQRFVVDLEVTRDLSAAGRSDELRDTVDYGELFKLVKAVMEGPSHNLIEGLAEDIATRVLSTFGVDEVMVRVKKPGVPIKGSILANASVQIARKRG